MNKNSDTNTIVIPYTSSSTETNTTQLSAHYNLVAPSFHFCAWTDVSFEMGGGQDRLWLTDGSLLKDTGPICYMECGKAISSPTSPHMKPLTLLPYHDFYKMMLLLNLQSCTCDITPIPLVFMIGFLRCELSLKVWTFFEGVNFSWRCDLVQITYIEFSWILLFLIPVV